MSAAPQKTSGPTGPNLPDGALLIREVPTIQYVLERDLENLRSSKLDDDTIRAAGIFTETDSAVLAKYLNWTRWPRNTMGSGLVFPYFVPGLGDPVFYRVRPQRPRTTEKRGKPSLNKYEQAKDTSIAPYFPPGSRAGRLRDDKAVLIFTEGEKKALLLDQMGYAVVGLAGVWNFHNVAKYDSTTKEGLELHELILEHVVLTGRHVVICFDADFAINHNVKHAAQRLAGCLIAAGAASVQLVIPPDSATKQGIDDYAHQHGIDAARALIDHGKRPIDPAEPSSPLLRLRNIKILSDAPIAKNLLCPPEYEVDERNGQLWKKPSTDDGDDKRIAPSPILIQRHLVDRYTGEERVEVCFLRGHRWVSCVVDRKAIADSRTVVQDLVPMGAPVTSNTAAGVVDWLEALDNTNTGRVDRVVCVGRAGWHDLHGAPAFVLDEPIRLGKEEDLEPVANDTRGDRAKQFGALSSRGDPDEHRFALAKAWNASPACAAMIAAAFAAPLLKSLDAPNFAVHLPGDSSRGKTSMLKIAASVYGNPESEKWVASWNTTAVAAELRAAVLTDLPLCFDEVGAGDPRQTEKLVYMLVNGGGRSRGQRDLQLRETYSWRTIVLSTGEHELADEHANTGAQVRVIQLPIGGFGELGAAEVDALRERCLANYGNAGRAWVRSLLEIEDWTPYREAWKAFTVQLRERASHSLQQRMATYYALLATAESMIADTLGIGEVGGITMQRLFAEAKHSQVEVKPLAERSLDLVLDWVSSEPKAFPELELTMVGDPDAKSTGGHVVHGYRHMSGQLWIIPKQLTAFCDAERLPPREVVRSWVLRGWVQAHEGRYSVVNRVGGRPTRVIVLTPPTEGDTDASA